MIKGEKVILSQVEEFHLSLLLNWRNNPDFRKYYREYRLLTMTHQKRWWRNKILNDDSWQYFVIKPIDKDKVIGVTGLTYIHPIYRSAEFAITIGDLSYSGQGYGSDALRTLIKYGFNEINLNRIWCEVFSNNAALEIYKHIGFKAEGIMRETYFYDGKYWDSHILSMLRSEWKK